MQYKEIQLTEVEPHIKVQFINEDYLDFTIDMPTSYNAERGQQYEAIGFSVPFAKLKELAIALLKHEKEDK